MLKSKVVLPLLIVPAAAVYGLDRGIYIGSTSFVNGGLFVKRCRYLFVTGVSEVPAHGGASMGLTTVPGVQLVQNADALYCRVFAE